MIREDGGAALQAGFCAVQDRNDLSGAVRILPVAGIQASNLLLAGEFL
jgi:hypothetical protein